MSTVAYKGGTFWVHLFGYCGQVSCSLAIHYKRGLTVIRYSDLSDLFFLMSLLSSEIENIKNYKNGPCRFSRKHHFL